MYQTLTETRIYSSDSFGYFSYVGNGRIGDFIRRAGFHDTIAAPSYPDRLHADLPGRYDVVVEPVADHDRFGRLRVRDRRRCVGCKP